MPEPIRTAAPEDLLAHAGWVQGLAEQLVRDPDRAGDVAQEAWLAALGRPVRHDAGLASWLGGLVRNAAGSLRRAEARRARREATVARAEAQPSTAELVEQAEQQRELVAALLALDEPYRTTLLLRYVHDRSPKEIAERRGIPGATVRSHLKRGLEQLRARLDERFDGDRRAWALALLPRAGASQASSSAVPTTTLGVLAMALETKLALAASVVALAAVGWLAWPSPSLLVPGPQVAATPSALEALEDPAPATMEPTEAPAPARRIAAGAPVGGERVVYLGRVRDPEGGPIEGATLTLHEDVEGGEERELRAADTTDADGRFRIEADAAAEGTALIRAVAEGHAPSSPRAVVPDRAVEIELAWVTTVFGIVTDAGSGLPVPGATVSTWTEQVTTGADGTYRLRNVQVRWKHDLWAAAEGFADQSRELEVQEPVDTRLDFALSRGVPLTLTVVDAVTGAPLADAGIHHDPGIGEPFARTDGEGQVTLRVDDGDELHLFVEADGYSPLRWLWDVAGAAEITPRLPLRRWAWIEGTVRGPNGEPVPAHAVAEHESIPLGYLALTSEERAAHDLPGQCWYSGGEGEAEVDGRGRFSLAVLARGVPYLLTVSHPEHAPVTTGPFVMDAPGGRVSVAVQLHRGAVVRGRTIYNGEAWKGWKGAWVLAVDAAGDRVGRDHVRAPGMYELRVPPGEVRLRLNGMLVGAVGEEIALTAEDGQEYRRDFVWEVELATIEGRVTAPSGEPLPDVAVRARVRGTWRSTGATTDGDGRYVLEVEASETYDVSVGHGPAADERPDVHPRARDVDFVLAPLGTLRLRLVAAGTGRPLSTLGEDSAHVGWRRSGEEAYRNLPAEVDSDGRLELELPRGLVDLVFHPTTGGLVAREVTGLAVDHEAGDPVTIEFERGAAATVTFEPPMPRDAIEGHVVFLLAESERAAVRGPYEGPGGPSNWRVNGVHLWRREPGLIHRLLDTVDPGAVVVEGLAPGRYELRAFPDSFVFEPAAFDVGAEDLAVTVRWARR